MKHMMYVFIGGGIGSILRYGISLASARLLGAAFPYGTLITNILGCFLIGVCFALADNAKWFTPSTRIFLMTGILGGLTTFSTYSLESMNLALQGGRPSFLYNVAAHNVGGLLSVFLGMWLGKHL